MSITSITIWHILCTCLLICCLCFPHWDISFFNHKDSTDFVDCCTSNTRTLQYTVADHKMNESMDRWPMRFDWFLAIAHHVNIHYVDLLTKTWPFAPNFIATYNGLLTLTQKCHSQLPLAPPSLHSGTRENFCVRISQPKHEELCLGTHVSTHFLLLSQCPWTMPCGHGCVCSFT